MVKISFLVNVKPRLILKNEKGCQYWWLTPVILATWEAEIGRIVVQGQPGQIVRQNPISKITRTKWIGSVAKVVECLLCKHKAMSSNPSSTKKKKKKKGDE
jgi:hypothetical protein